ncbi:beta-lactamase family protein [Muricauda oceani]|uniref:Beta-lactamase family protein n=1 Tax=Flagellimonas oceani TaxID=2698672 RepID=A0A6G7IXS4_9FLAO|nr:serine hydrolase domain-containing protein [Allomuricauda oceani]MBW8244392.1 beta-lactamase family protein [Allomuricauda oceani]QII43200.1 beta-lactamase family protein [Allomuricauda oceani]
MKTAFPLRFSTFLLYFFIQFTVSAQQLVKVSPEEVGMSSERLERLSQTFEGYIDGNELPGATVLVARKGKIAYFESFGKNDLENNVPMKNSSIFRIASQTKAIVSVGVMMLQERGKLLITDPVGKYMPAFMETKVAVSKDDGSYEIVKANRPITIRDLLTHTSGVSYGEGIASDLWEKAKIQGWYFADREEPILATVTRMADLPFESQPGERFVYGYNTDILGALIEVVSGQTLDVFLTENIFEPLNMNDTHFYLPKDKKERLATVYSPSENGLKPAPNPGGMVGQGAYVEGPRKSFSGGAGLLSTSMDYAKFLQMMLNKGILNGKRILSPKTVELMTVNHLGKANFPWVGGTGFGLGFSVVEDLGERGTPGSVGEYGWGGAYHSSYWVDPKEELVVVYFTQLIPANDIDDHGKLRALIYQAIVD